MPNRNIYIAGHKGMVGSAISRQLAKDTSVNIITTSREELDLECQKSVAEFFKKKKIDEIFLAAAKVGGIYANNAYPADFIYKNLIVQANVINNAHKADIQKLLFLGSSCIYPKNSQQPISENALRQSWERLVKRANIENFRFHDLRREATSRFFEKGLNVPEVALITGHKDPRMLFRYTKLKASEIVRRLQ